MKTTINLLYLYLNMIGHGYVELHLHLLQLSKVAIGKVQLLLNNLVGSFHLPLHRVRTRIPCFDGDWILISFHDMKEVLFRILPK